jgi:hypothetical protein
MKTELASLALASSLACQRSSDGESGGAEVSSLTNLGLAAERIAGDGELLVLGVSEAGQGADRNGDGDLLDEVAFALDLETGSGRNLGIALSASSADPLVVSGRVAAVIVAESSQGGRDLNGDGDASDEVLVAHVQGAGTVHTGLAVAPVRPLVAGTVMFAVSEAAQGGADLTGDGDALDTVPRILVPRIASSRPDPVRGPALAMTALVDSESGLLTFTADEAELGRDLNGDGDAQDRDVLQIYDFQSDTTASTALSASHALPRRHALLIVAPDEWLVLVDERGSGCDLDGDGDADDLVSHTLDPAAGTSINLATACVPRAPLSQTVNGSFCYFARESPGRDRNGDGDFEDVTPVVYGWGRQVEHPLALDPTASGAIWSRSAIVLDVSEAAQGLDLDGDGDTSGLVVHVIDGRGLHNLGLDSRGLTGAPGRALIPRSEEESRADWNGDGDRLDVVTFAWDSEMRATSNTAVAGTVLGASSERLLLAVSEAGDGRDWNADGDLDDLAYVHHDFARGVNSWVGVVGRLPGTGRMLGLRSVVLADEAAQGADLNRDGDRLDSVPFVVE